MEAFELDVRRHVYFSVVANGRPPSVVETASAFDVRVGSIEGAYRRLHDAHALVLHPDTTEIWMANPFCFAPTPHRVTAGGRADVDGYKLLGRFSRGSGCCADLGRAES